ncbi:MAG: extracellular solute-binding protein [Clostridia bacterium]|nr:extracellular solute-binding protein [Clostridia bacterium]
MKKILAAILLVALCLSLFAFTGCNVSDGGATTDGGNGGSKDEESTTKEQIDVEVNPLPESLIYDGSAVEITFYHTMGANLRGVLDKYVEKFNEMYPNITITHSQVGSYDDVRDKISTELTAGNQPNIAYCYPDHVALYNLADAVVTLDDFIASTATVTKDDGTTETYGLTQEQIDDFIDAYYDEGRQFGDGKMYTMPLSKSTEVLYYNATFFEEHDLKVPTNWDEMEEVCKKILEIDPNCIPLGYDSESNWFITMCEQLNSDYTTANGDNPEDHFLFDNETNREFVKRFSEWYYEGYVTTQELFGAYTSGLFAATEGQRSYMCIGSSAGASYQRPDKNDEGQYPFEVGITTVPQISSDNRKVISQGPSVCIFEADDQEVAASWLFVKYLTTCVEFQAEFGMVSGYVPVLESVAEFAPYKAYIDSANGGSGITALSAKVCLEQKDAYYVSPAFNGSSEARDQVGVLMQYCMTQYKNVAGDDGAIDAMIEEAFMAAVEECIYMS